MATHTFTCVHIIHTFTYADTVRQGKLMHLHSHKHIVYIYVLTYVHAYIYVCSMNAKSMQ